MSICNVYMNEELAKKYGINSAIILQNFAFWITLNKKNNSNYIDGKFWSFQTLKKLTDKFPFLTQNKIRYAIDKLVFEGILIKGNFNKTKYDRTVWYAFNDDTMLSTIIGDITKNSQMDVG
ncbi:MAG TPA: hypothetical protein DC057_16320, partial [Spirochaetia bacterium]|nr:hypothetical protein [Spirochaetia bacterium]